MPVNLFDLMKKSSSFVVHDYTSCTKEEPQPCVAVIPSDALFEVIEDAHLNDKQITISPVGAPIIDWRKV